MVRVSPYGFGGLYTNIRFVAAPAKRSRCSLPGRAAVKRMFVYNPPNPYGEALTSAAAAANSLQSCLTLCDPIDGSHQAPSSLGFSRQEYWSGLPFPSPMHESEN